MDSKDKQEDEGESSPARQPPTQRTLLEKGVQRVDDRIEELKKQAKDDGKDLGTLLNEDVLLKKLEANADRLKPQPPGIFFYLHYVIPFSQRTIVLKQVNSLKTRARGDPRATLVLPPHPELVG